MANEEAKLFVAGLPDSISEEVLKQLFEATGGKVVGVSLPKDRLTGRPARVRLRDAGDPAGSAGGARRARRLDAGGQVDLRAPVPGRASEERRAGGWSAAKARMASAVLQGPAVPGVPQQAPDRTLYVGNLPYDTHARRGAGPRQRRRGRRRRPRALPMDPDGRKRGFGFVTMASPEAAKAAADALRQADIRGRRLVVNLAHPKGERPARPEGGGGRRRRFLGPVPAVVRRRWRWRPERRPTHRQARAAHEERRKRSFEDGGGPTKQGKRGERDGARRRQ